MRTCSTGSRLFLVESSGLYSGRGAAFFLGATSKLDGSGAGFGAGFCAGFGAGFSAGAASCDGSDEILGGHFVLPVGVAMLGLYTAVRVAKKKRRVGVCAALCLWRAAGPRQGRRPPPRPCRTAAKGRLRFLSVASAKPHRAVRCSGCCKIKPKGHRSFDSSVKKTRLTFHRDLHAPPKSEERVLRISSEFMRRAGMAAHALLVHADGRPEFLPPVVDVAEVGRRVLDDVHLVRPRAVGRHARLGGPVEEALEPRRADLAVARQEVNALEDAHAAALEALELDRVLVVALGVLRHVHDEVREDVPEARLEELAGLGRVEGPVEGVVRAVRHGRAAPGPRRRAGRRPPHREVVDPRPPVRREVDVERRVVDLGELRPVVVGVLVPPALVLGHVETVHRRLLHLAVGRAAPEVALDDFAGDGRVVETQVERPVVAARAGQAARHGPKEGQGRHEARGGPQQRVRRERGARRDARDDAPDRRRGVGLGRLAEGAVAGEAPHDLAQADARAADERVHRR
eukprot:gene5729-biopygen16282